jgi:multimeric flavodoxin WrbA
MANDILILKGSPRKQGNSAVLADRAADGARETGARVESIFLHGLNILPCDGCDKCLGSGECAISDDMQEIYPKILAADAIILASPIYWFTFTAQLKLCIDRWYALWNRGNDPFRHKKLGIILTFGDPDVFASGAINAIHTFESMSRYMQAEISGLVYGSLADVGDAEKHPELMEQAYQLGRLLGSSDPQG